MNNGNLIIRIGFGLLFIWGGLEKFIEGFLGGVGLQNMANFLLSSGLGFLGESGAYVLGGLLAFFELAAGILLIANIQKMYAYFFLSFIMLMAILLVHIPSGNWMNIMIHLALITSLLGLGINEKNALEG